MTRRYIKPGTPLVDRLRIVGWDVAANGCWIWRGRIGSKTNGQYGVLDFEGKAILAHRAAYECWVGPIPDGNVLMHRCDTPLCINPEHLTPGTQRENLADRDSKGRHPNSQKTHCRHGHEYTPENTITRIGAGGNPERKCRTCARTTWRKSKARSKSLGSNDEG